MMIGRTTLLCATAWLIALPALADGQLSVMSFGGAYQAAQRKVFFAPYTAATATGFAEQDYGGEIGRIEAMRAAGAAPDLIDVDGPTARLGCAEGLFETLDWSRIGDRADWRPGTASDCAVGTVFFATVLAYDAERQAEPPTKLVDLFDTKRFPGKRGLWRSPVSTLEFALIADGVENKDVYTVLATPDGVDRAFRKLDAIRPDIVWWREGAEAPALLAAGTVVMTTAWNGRIFDANQAGRKFRIVWDNELLDADFWVIPKGAKRPDASYAFIRFSVAPAVLSRFPETIPYGPVTGAAAKAVAPQYAIALPTSPVNIATAFSTDYAFWGEHGEALRRRFADWLAR